MRMLSLATAVLILSPSGSTLAEPRPLVPEGWQEVTPSRAEGGERVFVSPDGKARLRLGHIVARRGQSGRDINRLSYRDGETITYQRRGGSWLAVSGYREGEIFYRKSNLACRGTRWHTVELQYPRDLKRRLDPVVTAIARDMGAYASDCG
jgi:hypothetical protein